MRRRNILRNIGTRFVLLLSFSVAAVLLFGGCGGGEEAEKFADEPANEENIESFFSRGDYTGVDTLATRMKEREKHVPASVEFYHFLSLFSLGKIEEAESRIAGIRGEVNIERTNLVKPIRFLEEKDNPEKRLDVYTKFLERVVEALDETSDRLRILEVLRIVSQQYASAEWIGEKTARRIEELEGGLEDEFSENTPLGKTGSKVE